MLNKLKFYNVADAKASLSKLISEAKNQDIVITKNGVPEVSVINYERYAKIMDFLEQVKDIYTLDVGTGVPEDPVDKMLEDDQDDQEV
ncbi:MAG: type II toxin-antitoxin system Phd/YefM family antitoxin [Mesoaciditoga sp.]|uniref:type II toxin-antitoxin system Phd/YefM family antitoxin n=1 Tax=Athalassotoga sp. TaxID=2022597 RepID=UPI000CC4A772|nr:MAG: type II toxin-antitoxin system Phd/YefM family antitoxin [Mesoaciditoga sp.]HEU23774.1 type II toxin-antitoxin system Phd/YefM family antitoxin [Mesoaciditoga lauensis]